MKRRPRIGILAPGHTLLSTAGSARNILATAAALSEWAEVTVVFRRLAEPAAAVGFEVSAFESATAAEARDDVAARGLNPFAHAAFLRLLDNYVEEVAGQYDVILEKGWRLSGYLCKRFARRGTRAILIENDVRVWSDPIRSVRTMVRWMAHVFAQRVARRSSHSADAIAAETPELKNALEQVRKIPSERIHVIPLGVDHSHFYPRNREEARRRLGVADEALVMVYVGGMDQYHDLSPLLQALREGGNDIEVHLVGDGEYRPRYEALAENSDARIVFHGKVDHSAVPEYIAAADVCLAPYASMGFHQNQVAFSTLKIPEYMACGRPVISIPSGNILRLVNDGVDGFLFENDVARWSEFLRRGLSRNELAVMGQRATQSVSSLSWGATAKKYMELADVDSSHTSYCDRIHGTRPTSGA